MSLVCFCIASNCDACLEYSVSYCPPTLINIPCTNLVNGNTYYLWIRDKADNIFEDVVTGNANGSFDINTNNFPTGMFTPNFGKIDLYLSTDTSGLIIQPLTVVTDFNCVIFGVDEPVYLTDDTGCRILTDEFGNPII